MRHLEVLQNKPETHWRQTALFQKRQKSVVITETKQNKRNVQLKIIIKSIKKKSELWEMHICECHFQEK